jgi:uncharacterized protein (DUF1015 family)
VPPRERIQNLYYNPAKTFQSGSFFNRDRVIVKDLFMARIFPFRAVTFDPARVGSLDAVVTQPYDRVDEALQEAYYRRHPHNIIRITKGREEPGDDDRENKYARAARFFEAWQREGILRRDAEPAIYVYHQVYGVPEGGTRTRKGFVALVELEPFGKGRIHPHEETHTKPKVDRLNQLRALKAHTGQVFLLYSDPEKAVNALLDARTRRPPDYEARDDYGEVHRVWRVVDRKTIDTVAGAMRPRDCFIADGHHRYETALAFRDEMRANKAKAEEPETFDRRMATFVNMDDEGLTIFGTHRLVAGLPGFSLAELLEQAPKHFTVREYPFSDDASESRARTEFLEDLRFEGDAAPAIGCYGQGTSTYFLFILKDPARMDRVIAGKKSSEWKRLDVNVLHAVCLHGLLGVTEEDLAMERYVTYHRHAADVIGAVRAGKGQVAFLLNPVKIGQIKTIVKRGERFPQKTTDFYPKLLSGLVIEKLNVGE